MRSSVVRILALVCMTLSVGCVGVNDPPEPTHASPVATLSFDSVAARRGHNVTVDLWLSLSDTAAEYFDGLGGFSLLCSYDRRMLSFLGAEAGRAISEWEYFTYRTVGDEASDTGMMRFFGIADMNDGATPPHWALMPSGPIVRCTFFVTTDRQYDGRCAALGFVLVDCTDNVLGGLNGDRVFIPNLDYTEASIADSYGSACYANDGKPAEAVLALKPGSLCVGPPTVPVFRHGDLNHDGRPWDEEDATLYRRYFLEGPSVWHPNTASLQIAASDCNQDGEPLTVADYEYLLRVNRGETSPHDSISNPYGRRLNAYQCRSQTGITLAIGAVPETEMSVLWLQIDHKSPTPLVLEWLEEDIDLAYHDDGRSLRILITSLDGPIEMERYPVDIVLHELRIPLDEEIDAEPVAIQISEFPGVPVEAYSGTINSSQCQWADPVP